MGILDIRSFLVGGNAALPAAEQEQSSEGQNNMTVRKRFLHENLIDKVKAATAAGTTLIRSDIVELTDFGGVTFFVTPTTLPAATQASLTKGETNSQIVFTAVEAGEAGNDITITAVDPGEDAALSVEVDGTDIVINLEYATDQVVSTVAEVIAAIEGSAEASALITVTDGEGDGSGVLAAFALDNLEGGDAADVLVIEHGDDPALSDSAEASGYSVNTIDTADGKVFAVECYAPEKKFARLAIKRGALESAYGEIYAIRSFPKGGMASNTNRGLAAATLTHGVGDAILIFDAVTPGVAGNDITVAIVNPGSSGSLSVDVTGTDIVVTLAYADSATTSTAAQVRAALLADEDIAALINVSLGVGDGSGLVTALSEEPLAGGGDAVIFTN